jgi:lysine-specific demethylase 8
LPRHDSIKARRDAVRLRIAERLRAQGPARIIQVERRKAISPAEFRQHFLRKGIPVVIENAAEHWACSREWTFDKLKHRYGNEMIKLVQTKGLSDDDFVDTNEFWEEFRFGDFLDQVLSGGMKYMRFSPLLERFPDLLNDFDQTFLQGMPDRSYGTTYQLFIGGRGTFTPLHNAMTPFFFVNVCGVKRWALIPNHYLATLNPSPDGFAYNHSDAEVGNPRNDAFPGFEAADRLEATLQPGDILYLPSWMWHSVENESPTIGVRCGFMYPRNMIAESFTLAFIRFFAAQNPSMFEIVYHTVVKSKHYERDRWLITPKVFRYKDGVRLKSRGSDTLNT